MLFRLLTFFVLLSCFLTAQTSYRFRNYTITDGLSQSAINTLLQDNIGFIWIGTQDGLNRFDGQNFEIFSPDNTEGIESGDIFCSMKSKTGILWFGTSNGLTKYDPVKEKFHTYLYSSLFPLQAKSLSEDKEENIWIGSSANGVYYFSKKQQKIQSVKTNIPSDKIQFLKLISDDELLISTEDQGLYIYTISKKKSKKINVESKNGKLVRINNAKEYIKDEWILCSNQSLYTLNSKTKQLKPYLEKLDNSFGLLEVFDILIVSTNKILVTSKSHGLITIEFKDDKTLINQSTQDIYQKHALLYNALNVLLKDKNDTYWVGSERGLSSFDPLNQGFLGIGPSANLSKGLPSSSVWSFAEDQSQRYIYIGSDKSVSKLDRTTGVFHQYYKTIIADKKIANPTILTLHVISSNHLLVGTASGLFDLTIANDSSYTFNKIPFTNLTDALSFEKVYKIFYWKDGKYLLATKGGVVLYNSITGKMQSFQHDPKNPSKTIGAGVCKVIYKDWKNTIWFTTSLGGLYKLVEDKELKIVPYKYNSFISKLTKDYIACIEQTDNNTFWLGTMGSGLIKWDAKNLKGKIFNKKNGLPNNVVYSVIRENNNPNHLWMSTNRGLCMLDKSNESTLVFTEEDGLMSNEFNQGAFFKAKSGLLFFGGIYGYNYFDPTKLVLRKKQIDVYFTKIKQDKNWINPMESKGLLSKSIYFTDWIYLPYKKRSITLKFMTTEMSNPDLISYKYILEGSEDGEVHLGNTNQLHLNSIQPGEYTLKVYAKLGNGDWSVNPAILKIEVETPYWKTVWFWVAIVLFLGLLTVVYFRRKLEYERREQVKLEQKITERTREIREQNIKIEKQKETIEEKKNHLEEQKKLLEIEKEKTEKVLKNILPVSTYEEIKATGRASARAYSRVSVLFTDFVGFTKIAETMKPSELVNELDIYFRKFDEIIVRNNLEKIKTIGDAYMCAGGVPVRNKTNPVDACLAALQIQETMQMMREEAEKTGKMIWNLRLGINTGEVTAGVIGTEKLAYDIWGSTVNQAQRMEMLGEPGKVTISGQTFRYIEPYFNCTFRGKAKTKSQGLVDMYTVDSIKSELSIDGKGIYPNERFHQILNLHQYSSINYYKAEKHIMSVLEEQLSPKLHYHSITHTKDVVKAIERLALLEGVTDEGLFLLKSAASYHDAGFIEQYDNNEPIGARLAEEILPGYGYSKEHIDQIKQLIYITAIPHSPTNHLEEIMCDADLDYLGREDFHEIADKLRVELRENGKLNSDRRWDEIQVSFLTNHKYFTKTAILTRNERKAKHLQEIKDRLVDNKYKD